MRKWWAHSSRRATGFLWVFWPSPARSRHRQKTTTDPRPARLRCSPLPLSTKTLPRSPEQTDRPFSTILPHRYQSTRQGKEQQSTIPSLPTTTTSRLFARVSPPRKTNKQSNQTHPSKCLVVPSPLSKWLSMFTRAINQPSATKAPGSFFSVPPFSVFHSAQIRLRPYRISSDPAAST